MLNTVQHVNLLTNPNSQCSLHQAHETPRNVNPFRQNPFEVNTRQDLSDEEDGDPGPIGETVRSNLKLDNN